MALVLSDEEVAMLMPEGKTKQEEIRAGTIEFWRDAGEKLTRARTTELTDVYFRWLADKGVVIKVDRELPNIQFIKGNQAFVDAVKKAGFEAVETIAPSDATH